jgi:hypothetical protein
LEKLLIPGLGRENTRQSSSINRLMYKQKCAIVNTREYHSTFKKEGNSDAYHTHKKIFKT